MHHFTYRDGVLHAEDVDLARLAGAVGTPFYCYASATLERHYRVFAEAFAGDDALVCYAMKANSNQAVLATLARLGAGMDIVSEGELRRALAAGVPGERIVFSGVGKTEGEMAAALDAGILCFNVESEPELEQLSRVAAAKGATAPVSIRVNPDVDARTHAKISTGKSENKFGIPISRAREVYDRAAACRACRSSASTCISAARSPISRPTTTPPPCSAARPRPDGGGPPAPPRRFRRRARHPLPGRQRAPAGPGRLRGGAAAAFQAARPQAVFEIGRMIAGNAGCSSPACSTSSTARAAPS